MREDDQRFSRSAIVRFTLPLVAENVITTGLGLVFSAIVGGISASSLAAAGTGNQAMNLLVALFSAITTGSAILCARLTGQDDQRGASEIVGQTLLLSAFAPTLAALVMLALSVPATRLMMPGAQEVFFREGLGYFRVSLLSLPALITVNALSGILRAAGESRTAMAASTFMVFVQLAAAWLFVKVLRLEVMGAGLAYVVCRYVGAITLLILLKTRRRGFRLEGLAKMRLRPDACLRILRVGLPCSIDALAVQGGYMVINTLMVGLGAYEASVNYVLSTLCTILGITHIVGMNASTTLVGQLVGAGRPDAAKKRLNAIFALANLSSTLLLIPILLFPYTFAGFFSTGDVLRGSAGAMWVLIAYSFPAVSVNVAEPAARVGGGGKTVMISCCVCVWLIRLPLTYLLCYPLRMGVAGLFLANAVSLAGRTVWAVACTRRPWWGRKSL